MQKCLFIALFELLSGKAVSDICPAFPDYSVNVTAGMHLEDVVEDAAITLHIDLQ